MIIAIVILVVIVIGLIIYNFSINKKVKVLSNTNQKINSLNVLQDLMNIVGTNNLAENKLKEINVKLREKFNIKYSTIVVFDGAEYIIKATNVAEQHWDTMRNLQSLEIFKESIMRGTPQYMTVENESQSLPYQTTEIGRAKSAIFFPLYIDNVYIGYWIIENAEKHAFDNIDLSVIDVVKENIITVLKTISYQNTMEGIVRKDLFTGLNSAEYLYGEGKLRLDKTISSQVCMFKIINLEEINEKYNRKTGNNVITAVANAVRNNLASEYIFVRYMGPKFVIAFIGEKEDEVLKFIKRLKRELENLDVKVFEENDNVKNVDNTKNIDNTKDLYVRPIINFALATYYKATGLEKLNKKLEEYLDTAPNTENDINYI